MLQSFSLNIMQPSLVLLGVIVALVIPMDCVGAFVLFLPPSQGSTRHYYRWNLNFDNNNNNNVHANNDENSVAALERLAMAGVSISSTPPGFFVLLESTKGTIPLAVTCDPQDAYATTSPESLTIIQLLSGVDMAGAILPPETLARLVVLSCESIPQLFLDDTQQKVLEMVYASLKQGRAAAATAGLDDDSLLSFADAHPWLQSRTQLPQVTLDELVLSHSNGDTSIVGGDKHMDKDNNSTHSDDSSTNTECKWQCTLKCNVKSIGPISLHATADLIQAVSYNYESRTSVLFTCIALALRYKAPIVLEHAPSVPYVTDMQALNDRFPQRTTVANLRQSSTRVTQNIERGFEVHKLTKALEIARRLGDTQAEARIRAELDRFDSFQDLPITTNNNVPLEEKTTEGESLLPNEDDSSFQ